MSTTIQTFLNQVHELAVELEESTTIDLIAAVKNQVGSAKLRILVIGSSAVGKFSLVNSIFQQPNLLPRVVLPKLPVTVNVNYGERLAIETHKKNGIAEALQPERLRDFFLTGTDEYQQVNIKLNSELLRTSEFRVEDINRKYSVNQWKEIFASTEYVILLLKATALLSEVERDFIREILQPHFGLERVAIIVNKMDVIPAEEQNAMRVFLNTFLGSLQSQPLVLEFSALQAIQGIIAGDIPVESNYQALMHLLEADLIANHSQLKVQAVRQAAEICLAEIVEGIKRQNTLRELSKLDCQKLLQQIDNQQQWLQTQIERSQNKIDLFVNTFIQEQLCREIETFRGIIQQQLPNEIMSVRDTSLIRRHLPGYIEAVWTEFFNYQIPIFRYKLNTEIQAISKIVAQDLQNMLGTDFPIDLETMLLEFDPTPNNKKALVKPKRGYSQVGDISTGLQLAGLLLMLGSFPVGVASIGVGQVVRLAFKKDIETADKQAIITASYSALNEQERRLKQQVIVHFQTITQKLQQGILELYEQGVNQIRSVLTECQQRQQELATKQAQLDSWETVTIPQLQQQLKELCA